MIIENKKYFRDCSASSIDSNITIKSVDGYNNVDGSFSFDVSFDEHYRKTGVINIDFTYLEIISSSFNVVVATIILLTLLQFLT